MRVIQLSFVIVFLLFLCSCSFEEFPGEINEETVKIDFSNYVSQSTTTEEEIYTGADIPANHTGILRMYKNAVDKVKASSAGFVRKDTVVLTDLQIKSANGALLNSTLEAVDSEFVSEDTVIVQKNDDVANRTFFPVYNTDVGCKYYTGNTLNAATGFKENDNYFLTLYFKNIQPASADWNEFENILSVPDDDDLLATICSFIPFVQEKASFEELQYKNCEIKCEIQSNNDLLQSLTHKIIVDFIIRSQADMIFDTGEISVQGTLISYHQFDDFVW